MQDALDAMGDVQLVSWGNKKRRNFEDYLKKLHKNVVLFNLVISNFSQSIIKGSCYFIMFTFPNEKSQKNRSH